MAVTALRQNAYRLVDEVVETGVPLEIDRTSRRLQVVPEQRLSKLDRLVPHPGSIIGDPDDLIHVDWSQYWNPLVMDSPMLNLEPNAS